ncbi:MAG: phosphatase PAP2 family protein [Pseudomonadota bacterium]
MTKAEKREKLSWFLFMIGYFTAGYLAINWFSQARTNFYNVGFGFENQIPFMPIFIFGYLLVYLSVILFYVVIDDINDWQQGVITFLTSTTLAYIVFLIFPVRMDLRPDLYVYADSSIPLAVTRFYYYIDAPYNLFPSLHVTYPALAALVAWKNHKTVRWVFAAMAVVVAVSVVLVKQHYIADVVAGFANAGVCFFVAVYAQRYLKKRATAKIIKTLEDDCEDPSTRKCTCAG